MMGVGKTGSGKPQPRPGDFERAWEVIVAAGGDKKTKEYLGELVAASAVHDKARTDAEAATAKASRRETAAMAAEASARSEREALDTQTTEADSRLNAERAEVARERDRLEDLGEGLEAKRLDLQLREAALRRAFSAYNEGD